MKTIKNIIGIYVITFLVSFLIFGIISLIEYKTYFDYPKVFSLLIDFEAMVEVFLLFIFPIYMGCLINFHFFRWISVRIKLIRLIEKNDYINIVLDILSIVLNSIIPFVIVLFVWILTSFNVSMYIVS